MREEELEELVLHVREVERLPADRGLIRLEVEDEVGVRRELGTVPPARAKQEMTKARFDLFGMERREAEVVEEVVAVFELVQLRARDEQEDRLDAGVALAQRPA